MSHILFCEMIPEYFLGIEHRIIMKHSIQWTNNSNEILNGRDLPDQETKQMSVN